MSGSAVAAYGVNGLILLMVLAVIAWRMRRSFQARRMTTGRLWILPAIIAIITLAAIAQTPPRGADWLWLLPAGALGGVAGWYRGRAIRISVDPATGEPVSQGSPLAVVLLVVLIAVRVALKPLLIESAQAHHVDVGVITDAFLFFALAMFSVQRIEMVVRARRLLARRPEWYGVTLDRKSNG